MTRVNTDLFLSGITIILLSLSLIHSCRDRFRTGAILATL